MEKKNRAIAAACLGSVVLLFLVNRLLFQLTPAWIAGQVAAKGLASLSAAALCAYGARNTRERADRLLTLGMLVCAVSDVAINLYFLAGMIGFAVAHGLFCAAFALRKRPARRQIVPYLVLLAAGCTGIILFREKAGKLFLPAIGYLALLAAMVTLALRERPLLRYGAIIFALSDVLLAHNILFSPTPLSRFISLGVYYVALSMMALAPLRGADKGNQIP